MANIKEYTANELKLTPSDAGYTAAETAARQVRSLTDQSAADIEKEGRLLGTAFTDRFRIEMLQPAAPGLKVVGGGNAGGGYAKGGRGSPTQAGPSLRALNQISRGAANIASLASGMVGGQPTTQVVNQQPSMSPADARAYAQAQNQLTKYNIDAEKAADAYFQSQVNNPSAGAVAIDAANEDIAQVNTANPQPFTDNNLSPDQATQGTPSQFEQYLGSPPSDTSTGGGFADWVNNNIPNFGGSWLTDQFTPGNTSAPDNTLAPDNSQPAANSDTTDQELSNYMTGTNMGGVGPNE